MNLKTGNSEVHTLTEKKYEKIYDINLKSVSYNDEYQCYVACKAVNMAQIQIFELKECLENDLIDPPSIMRLNFT